MKGSGLWAEGLALAGSALAIGVLAQTPAAQPPPTFRTEANYVRVDIYPTKDDVPVADLNEADFEILEGGALQEIEQFERASCAAASRRICAASRTPWPRRGRRPRIPAPACSCSFSTSTT